MAPAARAAVIVHPGAAVRLNRWALDDRLFLATLDSARNVMAKAIERVHDGFSFSVECLGEAGAAWLRSRGSAGISLNGLHGD